MHFLVHSHKYKHVHIGIHITRIQWSLQPSFLHICTHLDQAAVPLVDSDLLNRSWIEDGSCKDLIGVYEFAHWVLLGSIVHLAMHQSLIRLQIQGLHFDSQPCHIASMEIDSEIFFYRQSSHSLVPEGQLTVAGESILVNPIGSLSLPRNSMSRLTD